MPFPKIYSFPSSPVAYSNQIPYTILQLLSRPGGILSALTDHTKIRALASASAFHTMKQLC